ncbi:MAG TPA: CRISPR-associated endoribonuclease Cas6 [Thermodesulfobacteriota bacterium]|jgi:CRISPR-associated endoribonuclease Cas6|nr:CRISPR-associated endoribonuclease Cas6 [Thermodesulfobacteriota bacterium]
MNRRSAFGIVLISRLSTKEGDNTLPIDYRRGFISIIKGAIEGSWLYSTLFKRRAVKPYTFSVSFGDRVKIEGEKILFENPIELKFSTNSPEIFVMVYNHLIGKREFPIYNLSFRVEHTEVVRPRRIETDKAIFRTLSPVLIRSHRNERHYLCPKCVNFEGDGDFEEAFKFNMDELCRNLIDLNESGEVIFDPIKLKKLVVKHMGLKIPGFIGTFSMKASPEVLNLINQVGLGSRRSQGFGMVEVVREI